MHTHPRNKQGVHQVFVAAEGRLEQRRHGCDVRQHDHFAQAGGQLGALLVRTPHAQARHQVSEQLIGLNFKPFLWRLVPHGHVVLDGQDDLQALLWQIGQAHIDAAHTLARAHGRRLGAGL